MLNKVLIEGRFAQDPKQFQFGTGHSGCRFTIANDRKVNGQKKVSFIKCSAFGKTADFIVNNYVKGDPIFIEGSIQTGKYTGKDNIERESFSILVQCVHLVAAKKRHEENEYRIGESQSGKSECNDKTAEYVSDFLEEQDDYGEALPF